MIIVISFMIYTQKNKDVKTTTFPELLNWLSLTHFLLGIYKTASIIASPFQSFFFLFLGRILGQESSIYGSKVQAQGPAIPKCCIKIYCNRLLQRSDIHPWKSCTVHVFTKQRLGLLLSCSISPIKVIVYLHNPSPIISIGLCCACIYH